MKWPPATVTAVADRGMPPAQRLRSRPPDPVPARSSNPRGSHLVVDPAAVPDHRRARTRATGQKQDLILETAFRRTASRAVDLETTVRWALAADDFLFDGLRPVPQGRNRPTPSCRARWHHRIALQGQRPRP